MTDRHFTADQIIWQHGEPLVATWVGIGGELYRVDEIPPFEVSEEGVIWFTGGRDTVTPGPRSVEGEDE